MKAFYSPVADGSLVAAAGVAVHSDDDALRLASIRSIRVRVRARVAVYDDPAASPRVVEVEPAPVPDFIESLSAVVHQLSHDAGGSLPYTVIREIAENLIHADFSEPVVSILDSGATIRFADQGPGVRDKERVLLPGFTTACGEMKRYIRGVGSGLPIVREYLVHSGGSLAIEDNLGSGSVVTIYAGVRPPARRTAPAGTVVDFGSPMNAVQGSLYSTQSRSAEPRLSARQKQVLALVLESGLAGPSLVAKELSVAVSTAYRDLASLEDAGLISADGGKRALTDEGLNYLSKLSKPL